MGVTYIKVRRLDNPGEPRVETSKNDQESLRNFLGCPILILMTYKKLQSVQLSGLKAIYSLLIAITVNSGMRNLNTYDYRPDSLKSKRTLAIRTKGHHLYIACIL